MCSFFEAPTSSHKIPRDGGCEILGSSWAMWIGKMEMVLIQGFTVFPMFPKDAD